MAGSLLPPSVHRGLALTARQGGLEAIEHVVILMQENQAFDNYFGTLRGVRGFADPAMLRLRNGDSVLAQPDLSGGQVLPYSVRKSADEEGRPAGARQFIDSTDHSWVSGHQAWAGGWYDNWIPAKGPATMACYDRAGMSTAPRR